MSVTDDQVAALRAQLAGDFDEHRRLLAQLDKGSASSGYTALIVTAFIEAVEDRFVKAGQVADDADIVEFVGSLRARSETIAREVDPRTAERLILYALGKGSVAGIPKEERIRAQMYILAILVAEANFNEAQLDAFIGKVRTGAEELTG